MDVGVIGPGKMYRTLPRRSQWTCDCRVVLTDLAWPAFLPSLRKEINNPLFIVADLETKTRRIDRILSQWQGNPFIPSNSPLGLSHRLVGTNKNLPSDLYTFRSCKVDQTSTVYTPRPVHRVPEMNSILMSRTATG